MATVTYIVLPSVIKERMSIHENVDDKLIYPEIKAVQDLYILPLLGSNLFNKIIEDIAAGALVGNYKLLMDNYLVMCVCNYVMSELPEGLNYQYWNKGVSSKTVENSSNPSMTEMYSIVSKYKSRAEHYSKMARMYLIQNAPSLFPEYRTFVTGVDVVSPDRTSFTCPIYLGDESDFSKGDLQTPYNPNDPYYY